MAGHIVHHNNEDLRRGLAAIGSAVFFVLAPGVVAGAGAGSPGFEPLGAD
jgi:hypothetical protein